MALNPNVNLREAAFADYDQIIALESAQNLRPRTREEWSRLWLANPLYQQLGPAWPIGWVLEDQDRRIVGTIGNIPVPYVFQGRQLIVAAGRAWAVEERYRSVALMLMDTYFSQSNVDIFLNTTVNALAAEAFGVFGSSPVPAGDWSAASYWITRYPGFAKAALTAKKSARAVRPLLPRRRVSLPQGPGHFQTPPRRAPRPRRATSHQLRRTIRRLLAKTLDPARNPHGSPQPRSPRLALRSRVAP